MRRALLLLLVVASCKKTEDEAARRAREQRELDVLLAQRKITLYRVAKTALRSLPPRDAVRAATAGKTELTRDEWAKLIEADPALSVHKDRVGLFIVSVQLRESIIAGSTVLLALAAAKAGGRLAGPADPWTPPKTGSPFSSPADFVREARLILGDDEDRYATLAVGLLPAALKEAAEKLRLHIPAFEHVVLGLAWLKFKDEFACYELVRSDPAAHSTNEAALLRIGRAWIFTQHAWHFHSLDELGAVGPAEPVFVALAHSMRYSNFIALERPREADRELELARAAAGDKAELAALAHGLAAKNFIDRREYKKAAAELRVCAGLLPEPERTEGLALADRIEKELPESLAPHHMVAFISRLLFREAASTVVDPRLAEWADGVRDRAHERVVSWEASFPSVDDVKDKASELWRRK